MRTTASANVFFLFFVRRGEMRRRFAVIEEGARNLKGDEGCSGELGCGRERTGKTHGNRTEREKERERGGERRGERGRLAAGSEGAGRERVVRDRGGTEGLTV